MHLKLNSYDLLVCLKNSELSVAQKTLYIYICEICSWEKKFFSKQEKTICEELNMPVPTVHKYLRELDKKGFIRRYSHYHKQSGKLPFRVRFIYPVKFIEEFFYSDDAIALGKNAKRELKEYQDKLNGDINIEIKIFDDIIQKAEQRKLKEKTNG